MRKDAYWFKHDSNAKDDPKCVLLIEQLGLEGYGIYWVLIEMLRDQPDYRYPLALVPAIARRYNTTAEKMKTVIQSYGLFGFDDEDFFFSNSLRERMAIYDGKREQARLAAQARWGKTEDNNADAMQTQCGRIANALPAQSGSNAIREDKIREDKSREDNKRIDKGGASPDDISFVNEVIDYLNEKTSSRYRATTTKTKSFVLGRQKEGYKLEDFVAVIDKKTAEWKGTEMEKFLRPETLFSPSKFENYLNQPARAKTGGKRPAGFEERQYTEDFFDQFYEEI